MARIQRRYPFTQLAAAMGLSENQACIHLGISGSTAQTYRINGLSELVADRLAIRAGFHPFEVWPELLDDMIQEHHTREAQRKASWARTRYKNDAAARERLRASRRDYYAENADYEKTRERARYQADPEAAAARKRQARAARRASESAQR